jgi:N-acetylmuramoyl-L-alanine amidase
MRRALAIAVFLLALPSAHADGHRTTVVLDPGHGGSQQGAPGCETGVWEKDLTLAIAKKVAARLRSELGVNALLTREGDEHLFLGRRIAFANAHGADLFMSIHLNSMPTPAERRHVEGIETYFLSADATDERAASVAAAENADDGPAKRGGSDLSMILDDLTLTAAHQDASRLAKAVHGSLVSHLHAIDHGVQQAPFVVLEGAQMPAILCEVGFISHPVEGKKLQTDTYQDQVAEALVLGVKAFLAQTRARDLAVARNPR